MIDASPGWVEAVLEAELSRVTCTVASLTASIAELKADLERAEENLELYIRAQVDLRKALDQ